MFYRSASVSSGFWLTGLVYPDAEEWQPEQLRVPRSVSGEVGCTPGQRYGRVRMVEEETRRSPEPLFLGPPERRGGADPERGDRGGFEAFRGV